VEANARRIPAFVNPEAGSVAGARDALERAGLFDIHEVAPKDLQQRIQQAVNDGEPRILIAGGDGTIRSAVECIAGSGVELAVLASGTLNHFAKDHRLPTDLDEGAKVAGGPFVITTDVGRVDEHLFHGTSSIGAYVVFMRIRERIEKYFGYKLSSVIALFWTLVRLPTIAVEIEVEGEKRTFRTPLLFVAVGERELKVPTLGGLKDNGKRALHVMAVRGRKRTRLFVVALDAFAGGIRKASREPELDSFLVDRCTINMRHKKVRVSFDGEAQTVDIPVEYSLERDMLKLVVPDPALEEKEKDAPR
jgi:diacylglycerol kinase family enzyme